MIDAISPLPSARLQTGVPPRWMAKVAFALIVGYIVLLASAFSSGIWLKDVRGQSIQTDFINVWAAGRLVLDGKPAQAYDWTVHKAVEEQGVGHSFEKYFSFPYPPPYLLVAAALALLPYLPALLLWMALTLPLYVITTVGIAGKRIGILLAAAFPGAVWNIWTGQNGFLTAALIGSAIAAIDKQPRLAGVFLGLLSYKPQFGLLFPIVLVVSGQWRVIAYAVATAAAMIAVSWIVLGEGTWQAFFAYFPLTGQAILSYGLVGYHKLQSVFGVARVFGGSERLAWSLQTGFSVAVAGAVSLLWRKPVAFEIKAAALATAALLATPYLYFYDLTVLVIAMAFLARLGLARLEIAVLAAAAALVFLTPLVVFPTGFVGIILVALLIGRRAFAALLTGEPKPAQALSPSALTAAARRGR